MFFKCGCDFLPQWQRDLTDALEMRTALLAVGDGGDELHEVEAEILNLQAKVQQLLHDLQAEMGGAMSPAERAEMVLEIEALRANNSCGGHQTRSARRAAPRHRAATPRHRLHVVLYELANQTTPTLYSQ